MANRKSVYLIALEKERQNKSNKSTKQTSAATQGKSGGTISFEEWKKITGGAPSGAVGSTKPKKQKANADDYSNGSSKTASKLDEINAKYGISTASDNKKSTPQKSKETLPPAVQVMAFGAGDYGAGKDTRADNVLKGASQSTASSFVNTAGTLAGGTGELTMGQSVQAAVKGRDYAEETEKKKARQNDAVQNKLYNKADELSAKSAENIESAKEGLGKFGQTLVDVGVAGTQMLGDAALNLAVPGAGLVGMGLRSFGSGAQEQRQKGGTETDMLLGGLKSAAIEVFTERLGGFYGKSKLNGVIDDAIKSIGKSGVMPALLTLVKNGAEEAVEEILSDIFNPLADRVLDLDNKRGSGEKIGVFSEDNVKTMMHDGIVGGVLGLVGAGGQVVGNTIANTQTAQNEPQAVVGTERQTTQDVVQNPATQPQAQLNSALQNEQAQQPANPLVQAVQNAEAKGKIDGSTQADALSYKVEQAIQSTIEAAQFDGEELTREQALAEVQAYPEANGLTQEEITRYIDDGLGAANIGFTGEMQTKTSQYRTNTMERIFDPEDINDDGFEVESGNFDYVVKPEEYTSSEAQRLYDYHMASGGIQNVVDVLMQTQEWTAELSEMATVAQKDLTEREMAALNDANVTKEEYDGLKAARKEIATLKQEHLSNAAQILQAEAKWSRNDDTTSVWDEAEQAIDENEALSDAEKQAKLKSLSKWLVDIDGIDEKNLNANGDLKAIIKDIANERGTTRHFFNKKRAVIADRIIDWSLDRLSFQELQQLAMNSARASVTDYTDRANFGQRLKTGQILYLLSKPLTTARNITGNTVMSGVDAMSMNGAALADMILAKRTGTRSVTGDKWIFSKQARRGLVDASSKSIAEIMLDVDMGGEGRYGGAVRTNKMVRPMSENGGVLVNLAQKAAGTTERFFSVWERNNALAMVATDEAFKGAVRGGTATQLNKLAAEGKINADEDYISNYINTLAKERTFQQDSTLSDVITTLHDALNTIGIGKTSKTFGKKAAPVKAAGIGDIVAPFTKVAGNIVSTAYNYSVINAATGFIDICRVARAAQNGSVNAEAQAQAVKDFSRGMNGTVLAALCYLAAEGGFLKRADDEDDPDVAALNASEGMAGTQFNIDAFERLFTTGEREWKYGDKLLDVSSIEPLNTFMAVGTVASTWGEYDTLLDRAIAAEDAMFESSLELPILNFIGDVFQDVRYGDSVGEAFNKEMVESASGMIVPNLIRGIAAGTDEYYRDIYSGETDRQNVGNRIKSAIPGLRQTLPIKQTPFGEDKKFSGTPIELFLNQVISPISVNTYLQGDVSAELQNVREATGAVNFYPDKSAPNSITDKNKEYSLSYEQKQKYLKDTGAYYQRKAEQLFKTKGYDALTAEQKAIVLNDLRSEAESTAKRNYLKSQGVIVAENTSSKIDEYIADAKSGKNNLKNKLEYATAISGYTKVAEKVSAATKAGVNEDVILAEQSDKFNTGYSICKGSTTLDKYADVYGFAESAKGDDKQMQVINYCYSVGKNAKEREALFKAIYPKYDGRRIDWSE